MNKRDKTFPLYRSVRDGDITIDSPHDFEPGVPKFLINNVAQMAWRVSGGDFYGVPGSELDSVPLRPPFQRMWVEYRVPREIPNSEVSAQITNERRPDQSVGLKVWTSPSDSVKEIRGLYAHKSERHEYEEVADHAESVLWMTVWEGEWSGSSFMSVINKALVGVPLNDSWGFFKSEQKQISLLNPGLGEMVNGAPLAKDLLDDWQSDAIASARIGLYAFALLNCKNTIEEKRTFTVSPATRRQYRIKPSDSRVDYHILRLDTKTRERAEEREEGGGPEKPLHICRGHFRTYTKDAPMFGKYTGTYWIPAHTRGNPDKGISLKDYEESP